MRFGVAAESSTIPCSVDALRCEGSRLFECITTLPEYYPTEPSATFWRTMPRRLSQRQVLTPLGPLRLLELGAGTAAKTGIILKAATCLRDEVTYIPVDVSSDALDDAATASVACCRMCSYIQWWRTT